MTGEPSIQQEDGLGSITTLTAANGTVAETHTYDSFGNGNTTNSTGSLTNYFRYTGREYDTESGLYFYRARYYDSSLGRFLSEDPVGFDEGTNSYRYVRNDPALLIDPSGLRIIYLPPDPRDNTIVCDGHGGLSVQIGNPGTLGGPQQQECLINCAKVHEQTHISDTLAEEIVPDLVESGGPRRTARYATWDCCVNDGFSLRCKFCRSRKPFTLRNFRSASSSPVAVHRRG